MAVLKSALTLIRRSILIIVTFVTAECVGLGQTPLLGVTGASVGAVVATLNFSMNFIKGVHEPTTLTVRSHIKHSGHSTMVIEAEMTDSKKNLIGTILTTMFVVDRFKEIPANGELA